MIVYDLSCPDGHRFEGWFGSSTDYTDQKARGLLSCPSCGAGDISKAPMAPSVGMKGNAKTEVVATNTPPPDSSQEMQPVANTPLPPQVTKALTALAKAQEKALKTSTWVGKDFAEKSREMHYGERDNTQIHGEATPEQAQDLLDEGISVAPLPFPIAPPEGLN